MSSIISVSGPWRKFLNMLLFHTRERRAIKQTEAHGIYEEEPRFPLAALRIPHLVTVFTEWLLPKKSHRKEISLKKCKCTGGNCSLP